MPPTRSPSRSATCTRRRPRAWRDRCRPGRRCLARRRRRAGGITSPPPPWWRSGIEPRELVRAIERGDLARLTAIPGVGKKTSERIVLELRDRLPRAQVMAGVTGGGAPEPPAVRDDVLSALMNLGYHRPLAEKAVDAAIKTTPDGGFERMLKQALRELAR